MDTSLGKYRHEVVKEKFKDASILFVCDGVAKNQAAEHISKQKYSTVGLKPYKVFNSAAKLRHENVTARNFIKDLNSSGVTYLITQNSDDPNPLDLKKLSIIKALLFSLLLVKINNNFYQTDQALMTYLLEGFQHSNSSLLAKLDT